MFKARLFRLEKSDEGTLGVLVLNGELFCTTLEPEDLGNRRNVSCIPPGAYICARVQSPRFGRTFEITGVPGRSHILFHKGNTEEHTHGCVLLGQYPGKLRKLRAVLNSGATFERFLEVLDGVGEFRLAITDLTEGAA